MNKRFSGAKPWSACSELNIEPYPAERFPVSHTAAQIAADGELTEKAVVVCLAGRLMSRRIMGKASFAVLRDPTADVQLYLNRDELCPGEDKTRYNELFKKLLDIGDFIGVKGELFPHPNWRSL